MVTSLKLIKCNKRHWEFVRQLRTDPLNINGFTEQRSIPSKTHKAFMTKWAKDYRICMMGRTPVGFVGVVDNDIRVCVSPHYKKRGIGKFMIFEIMKEYPSAIAKIKVDNKASLSLFESCGFYPMFFIYQRPT